MRTDTKDPTRFFHQMDIFSVEAHKSVVSSKKVLRAKIFRYIEAQGLFGATCDEIELALELSHQTASARVTELKADDLVIWSGHKRKTRSGRNAAVLVAKEGSKWQEL